MYFLPICLLIVALFSLHVSCSPFCLSSMVRKSSKSSDNNHILQCLRGGNSFSSTDGNDDSEDDNYRDLRNLFGQNSDDSIQSRADDKSRETKQITKSNSRSPSRELIESDMGEGDDSFRISPLTAVALIWRGMPAVVKFAGWCLVMETARFLWQTAHTMWSERNNRNPLSKARNRSSFSSSPPPRMIDADDYLTGLDPELMMDPSISAPSPTNRGGSSSTSLQSTAPSASSLEQLQADTAELWSAVAKLHGIQTDFAASHQAAETAAEARWLGAVRDLEAMVGSVQELAGGMQLRLGELGQAVETLTQELDELQTQSKAQQDRDREREAASKQQQERDRRRDREIDGERERLQDVESRLSEGLDEVKSEVRALSGRLQEVRGELGKAGRMQEAAVTERLATFKEDVKKILQGMRRKGSGAGEKD